MIIAAGVRPMKKEKSSKESLIKILTSNGLPYFLTLMIGVIGFQINICVTF
jgi:hypothetical protein